MDKNEKHNATFSTIFHFHWSHRYPDSDESKEIIVEGIESKGREKEMILELVKEHFPNKYFEGMEVLELPYTRHDENLPFETEVVYTLYGEDNWIAFDVQVQPIMVINERKFLIKEV